MSIFQKSVIKKYLKGLNTVWLNTAYNKFNEIFSSQKIKKIKNLKEEEYQDGFLRDLFVEVLGYTLKPDDDFNLVREFKNQTNSKKADGAILKDEKAVAVIELKSTKTKDLTNITEQAFNYKVNQPGCKYVITSNFQKLRFYIDYANEYEEFDLFNLQKSDFELLYLILRKKSIFENTPQKLKDETRFHEEKISKQLYADYSNFKNKIFENLVKNNPKIEKLTLFKKTQKLLDRLLFIYFAEDCGLLPPNSIARIIDTYEKLKDLDPDYEKSLYDIYKQYFGFMNTGRKGKTSADDIPAYNGGLFAPDKFLDSFKIDDKILKADCLKLSAYDFNTEVDVNILGQIFEHSLNEIEEMEQKLSSTDATSGHASLRTSKRKKDGVFYTPKYITQYIIEQTIGTLCSEKRKEMNIYEIEFDDNYRTKKGLNKKGKELYEKLNDYKKWLKTLKILDPACGSGAFLNQALIFLIAEHKLIDDFITDLTKQKIRLFDTDKTILENNLFGVDINEESVEIAKLSLWLRTAQKGRELSTLNDNIKCGNSLIDDQKIVGEKAFKWNEEFKEIMEKGGFDVIVGNPPYFALSTLSKKTRKVLKQNYVNAESSSDIYCVFYELGNLILRENGLLGFITSNKWMRAKYGEKLRSYFTENTNPKILIDLGSGIFESATVDSNILIFEKRKTKKYKLTALDITRETEFTDFNNYLNKSVIISELSDDIWTISNPIENEIKKKIEKKGTPLKKWNIEINYGIKTGLTDAFIIDKKTKEKLIKLDPKNEQIIKPVLRGRDIKKYNINYQNLFLINTHNGYKDIDRINIDDFPAVKEHLNKYEPKLSKRYDKGATSYNLRHCAYLSNFEKEKIVWKEMSAETPFCIDKTGLLTNDTITFLTGEGLSFLLSMLNSKLNLYIFSNFYSGGGLGNKGLRFKKEFVGNIPILEISKEAQQPFSERADKMLSLNKNLQTKSEKFIKRIKSNLEIKKISNKLRTFYNYDFKTFIKELKKQKIQLTFKKQDEWEDYFENYKTEINKLQSQINQTDNEIDKMVYELYELTDEEINIIETKK